MSPRQPARQRKVGALLARLLAPVVAALALAVGPVLVRDAEAQRLGRLFSTPEERFQLDEARRVFEYGAAPEPASEERRPRVEAERGPAFSQFTINGVVIRSQGNGSTWVNGARVTQGEVTREGVRVETMPGGQSVKIVLPSGVDTIQLKAGQKIDVASGAVLDAYEQQQADDSPNAFDSPDDDGADILDQASKVSEQAVESAKDVVEGAAARLKRLLSDG